MTNKIHRRDTKSAERESGKAGKWDLTRPLSHLLTCLLLLTAGCAHLIPGADPLVVRSQQTKAIGYATLDTFLKLDDANRDFWRTNTPALHNFAEFLRAPVQWDASTFVPRGIGFIRTLDNIEQAYKRGAANSNAVVTALATVETTVSEAQKWIAISTAPKPAH